MRAGFVFFSPQAVWRHPMSENRLASKWARSIGVVAISKRSLTTHVNMSRCVFRAAVGQGPRAGRVEGRPSAAIARILWMARARSAEGVVRPRVCGRSGCAARCSMWVFAAECVWLWPTRRIDPSGHRLLQQGHDSIAVCGGGGLAGALPVAGDEERRCQRQGMMVRGVEAAAGGASEILRRSCEGGICLSPSPRNLSGAV